MKNTTMRGLSAALAVAISATAVYAENIKIAFIDPLSGPFAATGNQGLATFKFAADELVNKEGGVLDGQNFEIVAFDNKISPKESLIQLQVAIDQGIRFIAQGNSSGVANALTDAIDKHNRRNPDNQVIFLNYAAVDPALTNDKCNFWHFRFDANADIKMDALTDVIAADDGVEKVYIIGQDYSFGKAVAAAAVKFLGEKRPDVEIVGNELHPIGKVKDFTPYARKIMASEADLVITGNWGADMLNLGKSVLENGFEGPIYTYYGAADGITAAFGESGVGSLRVVGEGQINPPVSDRAAAFVTGFKEAYPDTDPAQPRIANVVEMLAKAINEAGTATDMAQVAYALEGMEHDSIWGTKLKMREIDHQIIQDVHIQAHTDDVQFDYDNSGFGLKAEDTVTMAAADAATTCKMKRP
ncbi:Leucine-, isoleucine-, valine-, threonine-, and alanine-binding protein precursor [Ruegeria sp. THAF57]|uniref:branched-chain amino acid ABC transporter substrate-binding protein n=1 Tax=unclassified Ruegeria TaxID=2625375 RepID=UPI00176CA86D|nr:MULTISPECIES: branched-chain amino acid ABC transporter substrate-binding protein [unclassified Ruegeria]CAD0183925.1 Leucine-, isoleucine-, valine-, threonine-, and alanine-binding protein precursor [Ruegeria sp. THAF57]